MAGILETTVELKCSPGKFFEMFVHKKYEVPSVCPSYVQDCELSDGEWGQIGSVTVWRYVHDGEAKTMMEVQESADRENNQVSFKVVGGDIIKEYRTFFITLQVTAKEGNVGSVAHWQFHYEKINEEVADPKSLLQFAVEVSKEIDAYISRWE